MPLSTDNIIQQNTGSFESTSGTVSLSAGTEAGSAILLAAGVGGDGVTAFNLTAPTGFTAVSIVGDNAARHGHIRVFVKPSASAGETSWTLPVTGGTQQVTWALFEMSGLDLDWPGLAYLNAGMFPNAPASPVASQDTEVTATNESFGALAVAVFLASNTTPSAPTISGYTNGFYEVASQAKANGSAAHQMTVAAKPIQTVGTVQTGAAVSPNSYLTTWLLVLTGTDSRHAPNVRACFGAEIGTATSVTSTSADNGLAPWDAVTGTPAIVTTSPRSGSWCLELSSTSAAENLTWTQKALPARGNLGVSGSDDPPAVWVERFHVHFPTSLPSSNVDLASCEVSSLANGVVIRYVSASQKIGVKVGAGAEQLSDATVTANQWIGIDYIYDPRTTTHSCQWQVDYDATPGDATGPVAQTTATNTGMTAGGVTTVRKGWTTSTTATVRYDDIVGSMFRKTYPIGDVQIVPLKVDPAGTPTVSGSSANFRVFTNNGTLSTWTAAGTRTALDDVPPTIGSTSDGVTQVTTATGEYVEVPMETFTCAPDYVPVAGRWYWAGWAASGNPAGFGFRATDGGTAVVSYTSVDPGFDDTNLVWMGAMHTGNPQIYRQLTQARIDALAAQFGFSEDANPDAGVHAVLFELVIQPAVVYSVADVEGGAFNVYVRQDQLSGAVVSYLVTTPPGTRGATFTWTIDGVDGSQYVGPNTTWEKSVGAADITAVTATGLIPDPTA